MNLKENSYWHEKHALISGPSPCLETAFFLFVLWVRNTLFVTARVNVRTADTRWGESSREWPRRKETWESGGCADLRMEMETGFSSTLPSIVMSRWLHLLEFTAWRKRRVYAVNKRTACLTLNYVPYTWGWNPGKQCFETSNVRQQTKLGTTW